MILLKAFNALKNRQNKVQWFQNYLKLFHKKKKKKKKLPSAKIMNLIFFSPSNTYPFQGFQIP